MKEPFGHGKDILLITQEHPVSDWRWPYLAPTPETFRHPDFRHPDFRHSNLNLTTFLSYSLYIYANLFIYLGCASQ